MRATAASPDGVDEDLGPAGIDLGRAERREARCTTTSAPVMAASSLSPRARSPATRQAPPGTSAAGRRVSTITSWPSASSRGTTARPSTPVLPVTITLAITCSAQPDHMLRLPTVQSRMRPAP